MNRTFDIVPFRTRNPLDKRFCLIDIETGKVVDDAHGCGYRPEQNALMAFRYKTQSQMNLDEKEIYECVVLQPGLVTAIEKRLKIRAQGDDKSFTVQGDDESFTVQDISSILDELNVKNPLDARDIFSV